MNRAIILRRNFFSINIVLLFILLTILFSCNDYDSPIVSNTKYVFGIDVSHYQKKINWHKVKQSHHPIQFVLIRATMGVNGIDNKYEYNRINAKKQGFIVGAYHYFRPNENSTEQFKNFSKKVSLQKGDLPPVLDIERLGNMKVKQLRAAVLNWLQLAEKEYGVKPIVYTGRTFYNKYLKGYIDEYSLWISGFSGKHKLKGIDWQFHQFTDKVRVKGIKTYVDGNDFNGNLNELKSICIK